MSLQQLSIRGFRNLCAEDLPVPAGVVAVLGPNGAGKSNLLEAVTVLGNLLSFRPGSPAAWVRRDGGGFELAGTVEREGSRTELRQRARLLRSLHRTLWRGARRVDAAAYLEVLPVEAFSSHDRQLIWGAPEERRRFLDRVAFHVHAETLSVAQRYRRCLRQRNALLASGAPDGEIEAFEHDLARFGARLIALRAEALAALERALDGELGALEWSLARPNLRYHAPDGLVPDDTMALTSRMRSQLTRMRARERTRGHTEVGPHRHDLSLTVAGVPAREMLSAGQGKLLATACKLAAAAVLHQARGRLPIVVFDDVDAELDGGVLDRILRRLAGAGQVLLSSAHDELVLPRLPVASVWRVRDGRVVRQEGMAL